MECSRIIPISKRLTPLLLALSGVCAFSAEPGEPRHRCDIEWIDAARSALKHGRELADKSRYLFEMKGQTAVDVRNFSICDGSVRTFIEQTPAWNKAWSDGSLIDQLNVLADVDAMFFKRDSKAPEPPRPAPAAALSPPADLPVLSIVGSYMEGETNWLVVESSTPLESGRRFFAGKSGIPYRLDGLATRSDDDYYYSASASIGFMTPIGAPATFVAPRGRWTIAQSTAPGDFGFEEETKDRGRVTAILDRYIMIDRGSLHGVHKWESYRIFTSSGQLVDRLLIVSTGERQSLGKIYRVPWQTPRHRPEAEVGDLVRKPAHGGPYLAGFQGGLALKDRGVLRGAQSESAAAFDAGALLGIFATGDLSIEMLAGTFMRRASGRAEYITYYLAPQTVAYTVDSAAHSEYWFPVWAKWNFLDRTPADNKYISPYATAGAGYFHGTYTVHTTANQNSGVPISDTSDAADRSGIAPVVGGGLEFFPERRVRVRADVKYLAGPRLRAGASTFDAEDVYVSLGAVAVW